MKIAHTKKQTLLKVPYNAGAAAEQSHYDHRDHECPNVIMDDQPKHSPSQQVSRVRRREHKCLQAWKRGKVSKEKDGGRKRR